MATDDFIDKKVTVVLASDVHGRVEYIGRVTGVDDRGIVIEDDNGITLFFPYSAVLCVRVGQ